ncbi:MAG TPA: ATP-dependent zinc metalloprotease FtsH [Lacipirellulaceae bacterium]|nr:ATP-dependent zinc metalloprotease FtsH [Lacipirellulaceae bacterium]
MDQPKDAPKPKTPDKKPAPQANNLLWYLLGLGVLLLLLMTMWQAQDKLTIQWGDFERLIVASKQPAPEGGLQSVTFVDKAPKPPIEYMLTDPQDIRVGGSEVTGTVMAASRPAIDGAPSAGDSFQKARRVAFRVDSSPYAVPRVLRLLAQNNIEGYGHAPPPSELFNYLPVLVLTGMFVMLMIVMLRRMGGAGSPMAFGRSRGKLYAQEDIEATFEDVAGIEEAVDELREVVDFLKNPERYHRLGGRIPKGVLLVGPPGTGKTLLAKAVAGEAGVPFFSLSGSDFVEMFVGVGAARVRDMFQQAEQRAPCIVFIDELDALGKTRGSGQIGGHDEREQTLNALLVEMDGFGTNSGIIIMAATNRPETLDPALLRPGRFDRHVLVDRPDVAGREEILEVHLQKIKVDEDVNVKQVAAITSGFVGADLANIVNEAALLAARNGKKAVGMEELNEAVERSSAGLEKKSKVMHQEEKLRVAYHESGHALVAYSLPNTDPVHKVSIIPRGLAALGYTMQRPEQDRYLMTRGELESRIQVLLAGTVAEEIIFEDISSGAQNDLERATEIARSMVMDFGMSRLGRINFRESNRSPFLYNGGDFGRSQHHSEETAREIDQEVKRIIDENLERVRTILGERRQALEAVTAALMEHETIDSDQLKRIMEETSPGARIVPGTAAEPKRPSIRRSTDEPTQEKDAGAAT